MLRMINAEKSQDPYLPLFVVDQCLHMHVSDIGVVGIIVCQGPIVGGKECQSQGVRGQSM